MVLRGAATQGNTSVSYRPLCNWAYTWFLSSVLCCRRIQNFAFDYSINGQQCEMVFSAVAGHLQSLDFAESHRKWHSCLPVDLYTAPVVKFVPEV